MTSRPMTEVLREASLEDAQSSWMDPAPRWAERSRLLSEAADEIERLSAAVRGMREALRGFVEIFADGEEHGGEAHDDECDICLAIQKALAALSLIEGEDEQARSPSALSAPISTDTKGTTK